MYAMMFKADTPEGRKLFAFAVPVAAGSASVVVEDAEEAMAAVLLARYAMSVAAAGGQGEGVIQHATRFAPVTVGFADSDGFLGEVVGGTEGPLAMVRTPGGSMTGVECSGPGAEAAYAGGTPVPLLAVLPPASVLPC